MQATFFFSIAGSLVKIQHQLHFCREFAIDFFWRYIEYYGKRPRLQGRVEGKMQTRVVRFLPINNIGVNLPLYYLNILLTKMMKPTFSLLIVSVLLLFYSCSDKQTETNPTAEFHEYYNLGETKKGSTTATDAVQDTLQESIDIVLNNFAGPDLTPSPASIGVSATGEIFVGVDMIGSLGKEEGKGSIVRLVDTDKDGKMDTHTEFAKVDNPRGIIPIGDKVFVLHTSFSDGKALGQDLVVFEDKDKDGIADGPSVPLITNISSPDPLQQRGADHATNGIRMGIDGWIYIAVGDFGIKEAVGRDGNKISMLGGGIVRIRPDGTEAEIYAHGLRNIYDVAIDPFMNIFTRGNTNDGGGWNIRFSHNVQSGEFGYPILFQNFTDEIIPALADLGGGSGTGSYFMDDNSWPAKYNHVPMMADWGRSHLFIHRVTPDGASFTQQEEDFIQLAQITDLDMDASGQLFLSAWDGAGYSGSPEKGFVVRAVPENWEYKAFPDLKTSTVEELISLLKTENSVVRIHAQQELLLRPAEQTAAPVLEVARDQSLALEIRAAGVFTYAQIKGEQAIGELVKLTEDGMVREFALRSLADRKPFVENVPIQPFLDGLEDSSERVQVAAIIGLGRLGREEAAKELLKVEVPSSHQAPERGTEGPHATPNASIVPAHVAVKSLVSLNAIDACLNAVGTENSRLALWALRYMHHPKAVDGLIAAFENSDDKELRKEILTTLARLYKQEAPFSESRWWGTRPTAPGPYYNGILWDSSSKIGDLLMSTWEDSNAADKEFYRDLNIRFQLDFEEFGEEIVEEVEEVEVDLEEIKNQQGQVGKASIEDVLLAMQEIEGDPERGKAVYDMQGCIACHSISDDEIRKGPHLGQIGSIMNREQIAESILKPDASIAQGFATYMIHTKDGQAHMGFITKESQDELEIRNIAGIKSLIKTEDIVKREKLDNSMMPAGLANSLSYEEFASLLTYLVQQKE